MIKLFSHQLASTKSGRRTAALQDLSEFLTTTYSAKRPGLRLSFCRFPLLFLLSTLAFSASGQVNEDKQATFFMGRVRYSANDGNDCGGVGQDLIKLVFPASTPKIQEKRKNRLTDPHLFETPFLFINGHNIFAVTPAQIEKLHKKHRYDA